MGDLAELRHDHHGCRLCVRQRAEAADEIERLQAELAKFVPMFSASKNNLYAGPPHSTDQKEK